MHHYRMRADTLAIRPLSAAQRTYAVYCRYEYSLAGGSRTASGEGESRLVVRIENGRPVIVAEGGRVLRRD
ncbi:MAG: hypothetical protein Kow0032_08530 [Methyloligellaceae bacterium]